MLSCARSCGAWAARSAASPGPRAAAPAWPVASRHWPAARTGCACASPPGTATSSPSRCSAAPASCRRSSAPTGSWSCRRTSGASARARRSKSFSMSRRSTYLRMMEVGEAWALLAARVRPPAPLPEEELAVEDAAGRVSARPVTAAQSSPAYHGAATDGFAVRAADTLGAAEATPVRLRRAEKAVPIDTGDPLPAGFDAVIMVEDVHEPGGDTVEIVRAVAPWQHVRLTGEDVVAGELVVPQGKRLGPYDLGALLAAGVTRLWVRRRPRVALLPTGD